MTGGFELRRRQRGTSEHHVQHAVAELRGREGGVHARPQEVRRTRSIALGSGRETQPVGGKRIDLVSFHVLHNTLSLGNCVTRL